MRCSDTAEIYFDDVRLPKANIIGEPGAGFMYQMMQVTLLCGLRCSYVEKFAWSGPIMHSIDSFTREVDIMGVCCALWLGR